MGVLETNLTKKIEKWWKTKGSYVLKFHGNNFTQVGVSDLIICYKGRFIAIEIKVNGNTPTPIQLEHIKRITEWYNGKSLWVNEHNWEELCYNVFEEIEGENND